MRKKWIRIWLQETKESPKILKMNLEEFGFWNWVLIFTGLYGNEDGAIYLGNIPVGKTEFNQLLTKMLPVCDQNVTRWSLKTTKLINQLLATDQMVIDKNGAMMVKNWSKYQAKYHNNLKGFEQENKSQLPNGQNPKLPNGQKKIEDRSKIYIYIYQNDEKTFRDIKSKKILAYWNDGAKDIRVCAKGDKLMLWRGHNQEMTEYVGSLKDLKYVIK
jgi:hypothetical protein